MAMPNRQVWTPLFLSYQDNHFYLESNSQGCVLYADFNPAPLYQLNEPLLLAQAVATNSKTIHLVYLKANGELCYSIVSRSGSHQTTVLTKLDVRSNRFRRLSLLPIGEMVHIFYAYAHQAIPGLWYIENRFWNGKLWQNTRLGEIFHPRSPLYQVSVDPQGNIHFLAMTFQGQQSILLQNRFHGAFHIWGNSTQALTIPREVIDMTAILTANNSHHLFWVARTSEGQFELNWAKQPDPQDFSGSWYPALAPIKTYAGPWRNFGVLELGGNLWLLLRADQEYLMLNEGEGWRLVSSQQSSHRPLEVISKTEKSYYHAYWLEDNADIHTPLFAKQLGLNLNRRIITSHQAKPIEQYVLQPSLANSHPVPQPQPSSQSSLSKDTPRPQDFAATVPISETPSKTSSILEIPPATSDPYISANKAAAPYIPADHSQSSVAIQSDVAPQEKINPQSLKLNNDIPQSEPQKNADQPVPENTTPLIAKALDPLMQTISAMEQERQSLTKALEIIVENNQNTKSALGKIEIQIAQLQQKTDENEKGFWRKWFK